MTMRRWSTVMWGLEAASLAVTLAAMYLAVRGGWPVWLALIGIGAAGVVLAEVLLTWWKRQCPEPIEQMRAGEAVRGVRGYRIVWTGPGSAEWKARRRR